MVACRRVWIGRCHRFDRESHDRCCGFLRSQCDYFGHRMVELVAGAIMAMAVGVGVGVGEHVSASSQRDGEQADVGL
jgi:hypothetical protein